MAGFAPRFLAINETTNKIYVTGYSGAAVVAVIDGSDDTVYGYFASNATPNGIVVNECSNKIYVANFGSYNITVYDGTTHDLIATIDAQGGGRS